MQTHGRKDQYVVNPNALQISGILLDGKGLVSQLSTSFELNQYSLELHSALMTAKAWQMGKGEVTNNRMLKLLNAVGSDNGRQQRSTPSTSRGASRDQGASSLGFSQCCSWNHQKSSRTWLTNRRNGTRRTDGTRRRRNGRIGVPKNRNGRIGGPNGTRRTEPGTRTSTTSTSNHRRGKKSTTEIVRHGLGCNARHPSQSHQARHPRTGQARHPRRMQSPSSSGRRSMKWSR